MSNRLTEKPYSHSYMEKKLKLLYIRTGINIVQLVCIVAFLAWIWAHPEIVARILGR